MPSKEQIIKAMDEWLTTEGLVLAERQVIEALKLNAQRSVETFAETARYFHEVLHDIVMSAVNKARSQGKCKEWPSA
ncbi:hypothetical protein [Mesorhizobium sp. M7A.F.Ca.MR.362.00.0.0]|uniref:hypothetical protein n=1 Tax=Mesorhizobium sp. M7A.F.Ca.MR.362.00.0.0 TaxID=2496779 RepID=UPI000FD46EF2|nr:hypothetical protein [Mesorhizobium sp. M7A.F.Ca.MR.362.00.0.0]RUU74636.1 hypothetical protein EOC06_33035 [Mesorhizobium sp. M7A.F.Ca.MR.362.00.0.0]RWN95476.1 MAG: hypothetical protein EOS05_11825 [Mesorhizobium sp.]